MGDTALQHQAISLRVIDEEMPWHFLCGEISLMPSFEVALECYVWQEIMKSETMSYIERVYLLPNCGRRFVTKSLDMNVISGPCPWNVWKIFERYVLDGHRNIKWLSTSWYLPPIGFAIDF